MTENTQLCHIERMWNVSSTILAAMGHAKCRFNLHRVGCGKQVLSMNLKHPHRVILTKRSVGKISCRDFTRDIARCFTSFNMTENTQLCHIERMWNISVYRMLRSAEPLNCCRLVFLLSFFIVLLAAKRTKSPGTEFASRMKLCSWVRRHHSVASFLPLFS